MSKIYKKHIDHIEDMFRNSFLELSMLMQAKFEYEKKANISNVDAGIPLEDFFRNEFSKYIPAKFQITSATIVDKENYTCGDCDFVVYDDQTSPLLKYPSTTISRRKFLFYEATYGIIEIKSTLTSSCSVSGKRNRRSTRNSLHEACEKLFAYKQLSRESWIADWGTELVGTNKIRPLTNTPFTFAFFYNADINENDEKSCTSLLQEFYNINIEQPVECRVNGVFVLNKFCLVWEQDNSSFIAYHPSDATQSKPALVHTKEDTLYNMYVHLANILRISTTAVPLFNRDYGGKKYLTSFKAISLPDT
jgi:hypothetical protein